MKDDTELLAAMTEEMERIDHRHLELVLRPMSALHLAGLLQLALRHPVASAVDSHVLLAETIIEHVRGFFADTPAILEVLRRGTDPSFDTTPDDLGTH